MTTVLDPHRPLCFGGHVSAHVVPDDGTYLVTERRVSVLGGALAPAVASLVDGTRTADDIRAALVDHDARRVDATLARLLDRQIVGYADTGVDRAAAGWAQLAGVPGERAVGRLAATTVSVRTVGRVEADAVCATLRELGVVLVDADADADADLDVVLTDDYLHPDLAALNAAAVAAGRPWLLARVTGAALWVGPYFVPGHTGCWRCLEQRMSANQQAQTHVRQRLGGLRVEPVALPVTGGLAAHLVAVEIARIGCGLDGDLDGDLDGGPDGVRPAGVTVLDTHTLTTERHELVRRPQCATCGEAGLQAEQGWAPVTLTPRPKTFTADGGHRSATPEQMLERYGRQLSPITGVVTAMVPAHATPDGVRVYVAGQNVSRSSGTLRNLKQGLRSLSAGKGKTDAQARASALGEAIERYTGVYRGDEARREASLDELGDSGMHPNTAMLFSDDQYARRHEVGQDGSVTGSFKVVPEPFDPTARMDWSPVWSLTEQRRKWLPTTYLYYSAPNPLRVAYADSNGNAAGTSLEDATMQGFFELVERDAVALWWYNRVSRPAVDIGSFADPYLDRLRDVYAGIGREIWALDLTSDLGIPVVGAFSRRVDKPAEDILIAFGAHFDPHIALTRAFTELNQFVGPAQQRPDGSYFGEEPDQVSWWRTATLANQPYLSPGTGAARRPSSWQDLSTPDLATDVRVAQGIVEAHGMELLVLDQTRPDIGLPVVKVLVPGLRHFWARFAPGRLYDAPVALGWLDRATPEDQLNPVPVFI